MMRNTARRATSTDRSAKARRKHRPMRTRLFEMLEGRSMLSGSPWQNPANRRDVNTDGRVTPIDALIIINDLVTNGPRDLSTPTATPLASTGTPTGVRYLDVNGDNRVTPLDLLNVVNLLAAPPQVRITEIITDMSGNDITSINVGQQFKIKTVVQDVRTAPVNGGVFAAYLNSTYDSGLVTVPFTSPGANPDPNIVFDSDFNLVRSGVLSNQGTIATAGASRSTAPSTGQAAQLLWTVTATATASGVVTFSPSFDGTSGHDVLVIGNNDPVPSDEIEFISDSLTINSVVVPTLSVSDPTPITEGNSGTKQVVFTVSLSGNVASPFVVNFQTNDGTATTADSDYVSNSGQLTFGTGNAPTQLVTVLVNGDNKVEANENFTLGISLAAPNPNVSILKGSGTATITNDDVAPTVTVGNVSVNNTTSGSTAVFTVNLSGPSAAPVQVGFSTADQTATTPSDYASTTGTLTFAASNNPQSQTITVAIAGDTTPESVETFLLNLTNPTGNAILPAGPATGTINPAITNPTVSVTSAKVSEGNSGTTPMVFTVSLSRTSGQDVKVSFATANDTATQPSDYSPTSGTLTFFAGEVTKTVTVNINGDTSVEPSETFFLNVTGELGASGAAQGIGTILDDDGPASLSVDDATVVAGANGAVASFTINLVGAVTQTITVGYATADGTAVEGTDYAGQTGQVTFVPGGSRVQVVTVPVTGGSPAEAKTFFLNLSSANPPGTTISDAQAVGTIIRRGFSISDVSVTEGNSGTKTAVFTVSLSEPLQQPATVSFQTVDGTATTGNNDYQATAGQLTFDTGQTIKTITVQIVGDTVTETNETFQILLSNATGSEIFDGVGTGTIVNDDGQQVSVRAQVVDANGVPVSSTVNRGDTFFLEVYAQDIQSNPQGVGQVYVDINYDANLITAVSPITYGPKYTIAHKGSLATPGLIDEAGAFHEPPAIPPTNPGAEELVFRVQFTADEFGLVNFDVHSATDPGNEILVFGNNDPVPPEAVNFIDASVNIGANVFAVNSVSKQEGNAGTSEMVFTITRFVPNGQDAVVVWKTQGGTATAGQDYVAADGTLTFSPNDTSKQITVLINGDTLDEPDETFNIVLSSADAQVSASPGVGTILDDDGDVSVSITNAQGAEGSGLVFTVSLSQLSGQTVLVPYSTAPATSGNIATPGTDFTSTSGVLTFAPGVTQQTITVQALGDVLLEPAETFRVLLGTPTNATLSDGEGIGTISDIPPAGISGFVYVDLSRDGIKNGSESGIAGVEIVATSSTGQVQRTLTAADGSYSLVGLLPGTWSIHEVQPGFYVDGVDKRLGVETTNDLYSGITLAPSQGVTGYNFGELGLRAEFLAQFANRRAFLSSSITTGEMGGQINTSGAMNLNGGDVWISFDGGWQGKRILTTFFDANQGSASMTLYNNALAPIAYSAPGSPAQIQFNGTGGTPYFLKISGTNPNAVLRIDDTVSVSSVTQSESNTNFVFFVTLSAPQTQQVTVAYSTASGSATAGQDFTTASGVVTFAPGSTAQAVTVQVTNDSVAESSETFSVNLGTPAGIVIDKATGVGTITNDDGAPTVSVSDAAVSEGGIATFTVTLSNASGQQVTVNYGTSNGTAQSTFDYTSKAGIVTFAPGTTSQVVTVSTLTDMIPETSETFFLNLAAAINATIADGQGIGTIGDVPPATPLASRLTATDSALDQEEDWLADTLA